MQILNNQFPVDPRGGEGWCFQKQEILGRNSLEAL